MKVDTASEILRILLDVHGFKATSVYREAGKSVTLYKASLHAIFEASMTEVPVQQVQRDRFDLNNKIARLLKGVKEIELDHSTKEDIRKAAWALSSLEMSPTAQSYFDYQLRRLLVPAVDACRRAWVIAWTNLRQDERARAEIYNSFGNKERAAAFKNLSGSA